MTSSQVSAPLYPPTAEPSEKLLPILPFLYRFVQNPLRALPRAVYEDPIVVHRPSAGKHIAWITGPALVEKILRDRSGLFVKTELERRVFNPIIGASVLVAEGNHWLWQRRVMAPLFRHTEILSYVPRMAEIAERQVEIWRTECEGRRGAHDGWRAIDDDMTDTTFSVIANTMLAGGEPQEGTTLKESGARYLAFVPWEMAHTLFQVPRWLPHPGTWVMKRSARRMREAVGAIVTRRRQRLDDAADGGNDLLARLIAARDPETDQPMTDAQLIDNLLTLLEAGHETTARALTWTLYLLARAPVWQQRVRDEVLRVAGDDPITPEHIEHLSVTERVIKETMRLYPPAPVMARTSTTAVELGGYTLEAGTELVMPIFAIHRHRTLWDDPGRFDPDRFLPEREEKILRTQYMPFGAGPRICLGASFAMVEAKTLLATFVRAMTFDWDGKATPEPISRVTLRPKGGVRLRVGVVA